MAAQIYKAFTIQTQSLADSKWKLVPPPSAFASPTELLGLHCAGPGMGVRKNALHLRSIDSFPKGMFVAGVCNRGRISTAPLTSRCLNFFCASTTKRNVISSSSDDKELSHSVPADDKERRWLQLLKLVAFLLPGIVLGLQPALAFTGGITRATSTIATGSTALAVAGSTVKAVCSSELLASGWTGLMAGCLHTLTGPDHLAALAPLSIGRTRIESAAVGALWGCGHDAGQVIFGLLFLLLKDRLHIDLFRTWGARVVGMTLLAIGAMGIKEAQEAAMPCLAGGPCEQTSMLQADDDENIGKKNKLGLATFATGIVHGLQPDALLVILPALALPSRIAGIAFISMFLLGTVVAMGSYTAFVGSCSEALRKRVPHINQRLSWGSSVIAIAVGASILCSELFGFSLF